MAHPTFTRRPAEPTRARPSHVSLAHAPIGWRRRIVDVAEAVRGELERDGLLPGAVVVVTARTPLGGPVVVELGPREARAVRGRRGARGHGALRCRRLEPG